MTYEIRLSRRADSYLNRLDRSAEQRVINRLNELSVDPFGRHSKSIRNTGGLRSSRVGDPRFIYSVESDLEIIDVTSIAPRGRVYRDI